MVWLLSLHSSSTMIRSAVRFSLSGVVGANTRHSAYAFRHATIAYRWHPLFGRRVQVAPHRRGKELTCIYTAERPDLSRELPNWMLDPAYCAGMTLGSPEISLDGLLKLADVLDLLGSTQEPATRSPLAQAEESKRDETSIPQSDPTCLGSGISPAADPGLKHARSGRAAGCAGRSAAVRPRRRGDDHGGER